MFLLDRPLPSHDQIERLMKQARRDRSRYIMDSLASAGPAALAAAVSLLKALGRRFSRLRDAPAEAHGTGAWPDRSRAGSVRP